MDDDFKGPHLDDPRINDIKPLEQKLFEMVYQWGRVGVVVDYTCPAFQYLLGRVVQQKSERPF